MTTAPRAAAVPPTAFTPASDTHFPVDQRLLDAARALGPTIREHAEATERARRLARPVLEAMRAAGLFRMYTPRALGGLEVDPVTFARVAEEVASHDSAAGWALQAGNTGAWWASHLPPEGIAELFADGPDLLAAAAFAPPHRAEAVPGGWRLTGRGALASTIHDAPWAMMTGIVVDGERPRMTPHGPEIVAGIMHTSELEIVDTWHSLGMRGTDSNDIIANDVFVPAARAFRVVPEFERGAHFQGPLYRLPAPASVITVVAPTALAVARGAIDELRDVATRKVPLGSTRTLRERAAVQAALAEAEATLRGARLLLYDTLATLWRRTLDGDRATLEHKADLMLAGAHAVRSAARIADLMHRMGGSVGIYERSPLERHFRDAQTIRHHGFHCESRFETVGQVYLGVTPEFPMIAF